MFESLVFPGMNSNIFTNISTLSPGPAALPFEILNCIFVSSGYVVINIAGRSSFLTI